MKAGGAAYIRIDGQLSEVASLPILRPVDTERFVAEILDHDALGLPSAVRKLAEEHRGLVLVTGLTGPGKTTTTAAMIAHINATRRRHIVTVEDPIEILHSDDLSIVDQREVGMEMASFAAAMRSVARQDPDVIFIGEMRDLEVLVMTSRIQDLLLDPAKLEHVEEGIAEGAYYGMQTFDQHILVPFGQGQLGMREALAGATDPHDVRLAIRAAGHG